MATALQRAKTRPINSFESSLQPDRSIGRYVRDLEISAKATYTSDCEGQVEQLLLR